MVVMVSSDGQADRTTSSPHLGHDVVRTAWSVEAGQLDAAPPRATLKTVQHCFTLLNNVAHMPSGRTWLDPLMCISGWMDGAERRAAARSAPFARG